MVEVGIPVYKAKETLPTALDSLVAQTKKNFIVCLSFDGDGEDYSDIINEYQHRGLKIRTIKSEINNGPGITRQRIIDTTICDYIMFLDADDMFTPRAVEVLYGTAKLKNLDMARAGFIREQNDQPDQIISCNHNIITWFHGKIYKVSFLRDNNIRFLPDLRIDEDAYFNAVDWNSTTNVKLIDEILYIWKYNKKSITREKAQEDYFCETYLCYIYSQVEALKKIYQINKKVNGLLVTSTLINVYYYYMRARFYGIDETNMINCLNTLAYEEWIPSWLNNGQTWVDAIDTLRCGAIIDKDHIIFYKETFNEWCLRLFKLNKKEEN